MTKNQRLWKAVGEAIRTLVGTDEGLDDIGMIRDKFGVPEPDDDDDADDPFWVEYARRMDAAFNPPKARRGRTAAELICYESRGDWHCAITIYDGGIPLVLESTLGTDDRELALAKAARVAKQFGMSKTRGKRRNYTWSKA